MYYFLAFLCFAFLFWGVAASNASDTHTED